MDRLEGRRQASPRKVYELGRLIGVLAAGCDRGSHSPAQGEAQLATMTIGTCTLRGARTSASVYPGLPEIPIP